MKIMKNRMYKHHWFIYLEMRSVTLGACKLKADSSKIQADDKLE